MVLEGERFYLFLPRSSGSCGIFQMYFLLIYVTYLLNDCCSKSMTFRHFSWKDGGFHGGVVVGFAPRNKKG